MAFVDFKEVKRQVSILQVLEHYGLTAKLKRRGDALSGTCPIQQGAQRDAVSRQHLEELLELLREV